VVRAWEHDPPELVADRVTVELSHAGHRGRSRWA
jgi:hypothetical protein